ncbi:hypothetical protein VIOR3934_08771 [Vibrio orientalis CIP 102891 = ATCC 33934]|uniref:Uncharacterized protein n=1 Tax=Vibrio orientalis CIP 102891 = ATCC 33934 TaxID=675816 RepID=C9QBY5_VIBOR|nr:hypothetical protein [Vibrio orientalis]EEX95569.1 hypothetical protein VIA_000101 [Vibrio orientalis CIP 102891 = ATCC 33934]EGU49015.1 hypothetical protein VIOR3934_08771 [Vibrio orientalis CIP 102891 = ATCC 33934]
MNKYIVGMVLGLTSVSSFAMGRPLPELDKSQFDIQQWRFVGDSGAQVAADTIAADEHNDGYLTVRFDGGFTLHFVDRGHRCNGEDEQGSDDRPLPNREIAVDGQFIEMNGVCHDGFAQYSPATIAGNNFLNGHFIGKEEVKIGSINQAEQTVMEDYTYTVSAQGFQQASLQALKAKQQ